MSMLNKQVDEETMEQEMSFYVDTKHQENPPKPNNPNLYITNRPEMTVYTRYVLNFKCLRVRMKFEENWKSSKKNSELFLTFPACF